MTNNRNNIQLTEHFNLREFETPEGFVMIDGRIPPALESIRDLLNDSLAARNEEVWIIITCATRTYEHNNELAKRLGWTDEGGLVARDSKHLPGCGGIAVDVVALRASGSVVRPEIVCDFATTAGFTFTKAYADGHAHLDMRSTS